MIRALLRHGFLGTFSPELSLLSGLTVDVGIGFPPQSIRLGLDFFSSSSSLFLDDDCPLFVDCYASTNSMTLFRGLHARTPEETVWLGNLRVETVSFGPTSVLSPLKPRYRDVAGTLGVSPESFFFANRAVVFIIEADGRIKANVFKTAPEELRWAIPSIPYSWQFPVSVVLNNEEIVDSEFGLRLEMDFLEHGLVLPTFMHRRIQRALASAGIDIYDDLRVRCSGHVFKFRFGFGNNLWLTLRSEALIDLADQLTVVNTEGESVNMCKLHIRFAQRLSGTVGRILFVSSGVGSRFWFNFSSKSFSFHQMPTDPSRIESRVFVPLFNQPTLFDQRLEFSRANGDGDLLLLKEYPEKTRILTTGDSSDCWNFLSVSGKLAPNELQLAGDSRLRSFAVSETQIVFHLSASEGDDLTIISEHGSIMRFCVRRDSLSEFHLPKPQTCEECENLCAICLEGIEAGALVQRMNDCCHSFHKNCVNRWFALKRDCPTCRTPVQTTTTTAIPRACII